MDGREPDGAGLPGCLRNSLSATACHPSTPMHAQIQIETPEQGWTATFVEATFADGFVVTTPVQVLPDRYPTAAPPETGPLCKTLPEMASR